jgi:hypothetical protein
VFVKDQNTVTGDDGKFSMPEAPATYDAYVRDPDGLTVSVFNGLTRRDPVLVHAGTVATTARAILSGTLSGGAQYPLVGADAVTVGYLSPEASYSMALGGSLPIGTAGPTFGPLSVQWAGPETITGELVAIGTFSGGDAGQTNWFCSAPMALSDGDTRSNVAVQLQPVARSGAVSGVVDVPDGGQLVQTQLLFHFPDAGAPLIYATQQRPGRLDFDVVPDLSDAGAELCVVAAGVPGSYLTQRCGVVPGSQGVNLTLQAAPSLLSPADQATVSVSTAFTWNQFANGIHLLSLEPAVPTKATPRIHFFTTATTTTWPDLSSIGLAYPVAYDYQCDVEGFGPYVSMDDAFGPSGIAMPNPVELRRGTSEMITVSTQ